MGNKTAHSSLKATGARIREQRKTYLSDEWSAANRAVNYGLRIKLAIFVVGFVVFSLFHPHHAFTALSYGLSGIILFMAGIRLLTCGLALFGKPKTFPDPKQWPLYTVLVPLRNEAHMVPSLMKALSLIDYPKDRIEIFIITESIDIETTIAVTAHLKPLFKSIIVPVSLPATKPKALNFAMQFAKGDLVTIFDAEDHPDPQQLKAAARYLCAKPDIAALQAPLGYYNARRNLVTALFAMEYASLFHVWNPGLFQLGLVFPLGGTSNHIRHNVLEQIGLWDPHNVTEDADLSFRLAAYGHKCGTIAIGTQEEAVETLPDWIGQRTRWQKGFLQTWSVHMRHQRGMKRREKWIRFLSLQVTVGFTFLSGLIHPVAITVMSVAMALDLTHALSIAIKPVFLGVLVMGYGSVLISVLIGLWKSGQLSLWPRIPFLLGYWLLFLVPTVIAIFQFYREPFYWNKTSHLGGRSAIDD